VPGHEKSGSTLPAVACSSDHLSSGGIVAGHRHLCATDRSHLASPPACPGLCRPWRRGHIIASGPDAEGAVTSRGSRSVPSVRRSDPGSLRFAHERAGYPVTGWLRRGCRAISSPAFLARSGWRSWSMTCSNSARRQNRLCSSSTRTCCCPACRRCHRGPRSPPLHRAAHRSERPRPRGRRGISDLAGVRP
jgi:hypothetical protein